MSGLRARVRRLARRLEVKADRPEVVTMVDDDEIRASHAALPPVVSAAEALGLLGMLGREIDPGLGARHGMTPLRAIVARYGRIVMLGGESRPITRLDEAITALSGDGSASRSPMPRDRAEGGRWGCERAQAGSDGASGRGRSSTAARRPT